jgi:isopentenyl-diphosphate Delta-isomerase
MPGSVPVLCRFRPVQSSMSLKARPGPRSVAAPPILVAMGPDTDTDSGVSGRKRDHLDRALAPSSQSARPAGWDDVDLVPAALPGVSPHEVDLWIDLLGHRLAAPVVLAGMTGGHPDATELNAVLGAAAQRLGLAVGVGSQRAALIEPELAGTFAAVRRRAPDALVLANVGACQLIDQGPVAPLGAEGIGALVAMVGADALAVHLNVVQELVQTEGDRHFSALGPAIAAVVAACPVPVIVKETGAGLDRASAAMLVRSGVAALDVGGLGGTSFARVEAGRAAATGDGRGVRLGRTFADWGIPSAASVLEVRGAGVPVIATGGVRSGLDAARALALGASAVGLGRPALVAALAGEDALVAELEMIIEELRVALVLCGARRPADLAPPVLHGRTLEWARQRNLR